MAKAWDTPGWKEMVEWKAVPYGNAKEDSEGKVQCQHGPGECEGNRWEQCAVYAYPQEKHVPFIICLEKFGAGMLDKVEHCAKESALDYDTLSACFNGAKSKELEQQAAKDTPSDHIYVPWILINGKLSPSDGDRILEEVCEAYKGKTPAACKKHQNSTELSIRDPDETRVHDARCFEQKVGTAVV